MMEKLWAFLIKIGLVPRGEIYYIGGSDILPPPLKGQIGRASCRERVL